MRWILYAAAAYHVVWGLAAMAFLTQPYSWVGLEPPLHGVILQSLGLLMACFGIGFGIAAFDPIRRWLIVLIGFISKVLGAVGFVAAAWSGSIPWSAGISIPFDDLIWLPPFAVILREAYRRHVREEDGATVLPRTRATLKHMSQRGHTLLELSQTQPVLAVFLRHSGCVFCREALSDLSHARSELEARGIQLALVHMIPEPEAEAFFAKYGLEGLDRFSDPECELYRAFELPRAVAGEFLAPAVWVRGIRALLRSGHGIGSPTGDTLRMPGAFLISNGQVVRAYPYAGPADRPDYLRFVDEANVDSNRYIERRGVSATTGRPAAKSGLGST